MPFVCRYVRPHPRYHTARSAGRAVWHARYRGESDVAIIAHVLEAFGIKQFSCQVVRLLDFLNTGFFLGGVLGLLKALDTILKGIKLLVTRSPSRIIGGILETIIPKKWSQNLAAFYLYIGTISAGLNALIVFLTAIANNVTLYVLVSEICETEVKPYKPLRRLYLGSLAEDIDRFVSEGKGE